MVDNFNEGYGYGPAVAGQDNGELSPVAGAKAIIVEKTKAGVSSADALNSKVEGEMGVRKDTDFDSVGKQS